ncbi:hypothetical protein [Paenibacillus aestuarii]|uniref:Uncharacterized protein n=1 Tax=Paenibacillus aestuarii TaxID=516965 RepID=A0ABW0KK11_9BACL|nr:hypothetical protein [Paenibacillus aestuarii]
MKENELVIRYNLLPWYNELDDLIDIDQPDFPAAFRGRIHALGEYTLTSITNKEAHFQKTSSKSKSE